MKCLKFWNLFISLSPLYNLLWNNVLGGCVNYFFFTSFVHQYKTGRQWRNFVQMEQKVLMLRFCVFNHNIQCIEYNVYNYLSPENKKNFSSLFREYSNECDFRIVKQHFETFSWFSFHLVPKIKSNHFYAMCCLYNNWL